MDPDWELLFVLPNLDLSEAEADDLAGLSLAPNLMAITPVNDDRVRRIMNRSAAARLLLTAFKDSSGERVQPSVLIGSEAGRSATSSAEAVFAFRNSIALAHVLAARNRDALWQDGNAWSDRWDVHPTSVSIDGRSLVIYSPAVGGYFPEPDEYHACTADHLPGMIRLPLPDDRLLWSFSRLWNQRYYGSTVRDSRRSRVLFRSLETAYLACSVGGRHYGSYYEYGLNMGLWVSAIETLAAPGPQPRPKPWSPGQKRRKKAAPDVNLPTVLDLLGKHCWFESALNERRYQKKVFGSTRRLNLIQRLYTLMYDARNRFLHGDVVNVDLLRYRSGTPLMKFAAFVYWAALRAFLAPVGEPPLGTGWSTESDLERALLHHASLS